MTCTATAQKEQALEKLREQKDVMKVQRHLLKECQGKVAVLERQLALQKDYEEDELAELELEELETMMYGLVEKMKLISIQMRKKAKGICEICLGNEKTHVLGCGHRFCNACCEKVKKQDGYHCPNCRQIGSTKIKVYN